MPHAAPVPANNQSELTSERPPIEDDSSLTSLSDLEEVAIEPGAMSRVGKEKGERIQQPSEIRTVNVAAPRKSKKGNPRADGRRKRTAQANDFGETTKRTVFAAPPTPNLNSLLTRRDREFEMATRQATADFSLQEESFSLVQAAVESLPTGEQQTMMCLMLNRLASFCTAVDIPIFPLSPIKLSLFLSQALEIVLVDTTSNPLHFPLPTVNPSDRSNLTLDEGTRLTRELAEAWIQAFGFAQLATARTWEKLALSSASLLPLSEDGTIREILAAIPSIQDWTEYEATVELPLRVRDKPTSKTRWVRGGKPVEGPSQVPQSAVSLSTKDSTSSSRPIFNEPSTIEYAYAFEMPIPRPAVQALQ